MTRSARQLLPTALGALLLAATLGGCATASVGSPAPESTSTPDGSIVTPRAAWFDASSFVIETTGRSCAPMIDELVAGDQELDVVLTEVEGSECTAETTSRGTYLQLPAGFDSAESVTLNVTGIDGVASVVILPGLESGAIMPADKMSSQLPAAAWIGENRLAVLTWGSSSCVPGSGEIAGGGDAGTLIRLHEHTDTFCTMDFAPQITFVDAPGIAQGEVLTLADRVDDAGRPFVVTPVS